MSKNHRLRLADLDALTAEAEASRSDNVSVPIDPRELLALLGEVETSRRLAAKSQTRGEDRSLTGLDQIEAKLCQWVEDQSDPGNLLCATHVRSEVTSVDGRFCDQWSAWIALAVLADSIAAVRARESAIRHAAEADRKCPCCSGYSRILKILNGTGD